MTQQRQTAAYKGVRDFYPEEQFIKNYIAETMADVCRNYGYQEYSASILEPTDLYRDKTSDEIVNEQTYSFTDRGGREVTLRPEMTPTVARMVAAKRRELVYPLRLFSNPNCFRYERPQKGRGREFWQLNVDIFGETSVEAEVEIIALTNDLLKAFGATPEMYTFRVNDRQAMNAILNQFEVMPETRREVMRLLDGRAKMTAADFATKLEEYLGTEAAAFIEAIENITSSDLEQLMIRLRAMGIENVEIDPSIVRGFDYYTGIVFELFDTSGENNRAMFGGGRYDNLVSDLFGGDVIPAVGTGIGDMTMQDFLTTHQLLPDYRPNARVLVATVGNDAALMPYADKLVAELRAEYINTATHYSEKLDKALKYANKLGIPYVVIVGDEELAQSKYTLKNMQTGEQEMLDTTALFAIL